MPEQQQAESLNQRLLARAAELARALADATEAMGRPRPAMQRVGEHELLALSCDEATQAQAERAVAGFETEDGTRARRGGGDAFWHRNVGIMKLGFIQALATAYRETGDGEYAQAARDYIEDFFDYFAGTGAGEGGVHTSARIRSWLGALPAFLDAEAFDEAFVQRVVESLRDHLAAQAQNVKGPGNVRLFQAIAFLKGRLHLPFCEESEQWRELACDIFNDTAHRDLEPDGSHVEHDPHYHNLYQKTFEDLLLWSRAFPEERIPGFPEKAARVFDYAVHSRRPNGQESGMQDGVAAWVCEGSVQPLLDRRAAVRRLADLPDTAPALAQCFDDAGHVLMRDRWDADATYVTFDATRWGGAHSHLARNAIQLQAGGRMLATDPGFFTYAMQHAAHRGDALTNAIGPYAKSTPAHNTLNLNGWNQAPTNPDLLKARLAPGFHAVFSRYSGGYWPGAYGWWFGEGFGAGVHAVHDRLMFWLPKRDGGSQQAVVVVDTMLRWDETAHGSPEQRDPSLEMNWQLTPGPAHLDAANRRLVTDYAEANLLMLFPRLAEGMELELKEGGQNPFRGWVGMGREAADPLRKAGELDKAPMKDWADREYTPSPQVCAVAAPMQGFGETLVTVLVPFEGERAPEVTAEPGGIALNEHVASEGTGTLTLRWADGTRDELAWTPAMRSPIGAFGDGRTDASALHVRRDARETIVDATAHEATYCEPFANERREAPGAIEHR